MRKLLLLAILLSVSSLTLISFVQDFSAHKKRLTLEEALAKNMISINVKALGGHTGECIQLDFQNTYNNDTTFYLEPGRRFVSMDSTIQDILIVKENVFMLAAGQKKTLNGFGFCCQASNGSPYHNAVYTSGQMADTNLVLLANHLNKNDYSNSAMQGAVWVLSDNKPLSAIWDDDKENCKKIRELQRFVATLAGISIDFAWYSIKYKQDTTVLFSGIHDTLTGEIDYRIFQNSEVSLIMYDSIGEVIHTFFKHKMQNPGTYVFPVEFSVNEWPKGQYYIRLFAEGQMKQERTFIL